MDAKLEASVELLEGMAFRVRSGTGHDLVFDTSDDLGDADRGPTPMELVLLGPGGGVETTGIGILNEMRQEVTSYQIRLTGETVATHPKALTAIVLDHVIRGRGRIPDLVHRVVERFATRYGPASALLWPVALTDDATGTEVKGTLTR